MTNLHLQKQVCNHYPSTIKTPLVLKSQRIKKTTNYFFLVFLSNFCYPDLFYYLFLFEIAANRLFQYFEVMHSSRKMLHASRNYTWKRSCLYHFPQCLKTNIFSKSNAQSMFHNLSQFYLKLKYFRISAAEANTKLEIFQALIGN